MVEGVKGRMFNNMESGDQSREHLHTLPQLPAFSCDLTICRLAFQRIEVNLVKKLSFTGAPLIKVTGVLLPKRCGQNEFSYLRVTHPDK